MAITDRSALAAGLWLDISGAWLARRCVAAVQDGAARARSSAARRFLEELA
jgi:hypothetical protein